MSIEREPLGKCECCDRIICEGDPHFSYSDGPVVCEDHAPLKSEMAKDLREWAAGEPFIEDESLNYPTVADVIAKADQLDAEIASCGDCKVLAH